MQMVSLWSHKFWTLIMEKVNHLYEEDTKGVASIKIVDISEKDARLYNLGCIMNDRPIMMLEAGTYTNLYVNGDIMMTDTPMEQNTNMEFIWNAHGDVLIGGLGVGLILYNLREKINKGIVTSITVMEKYQDVIDLVLPRIQPFLDGSLKVILQDVLEYKPAKEEKFDTIYFDIWPSISSDNYSDMVLLHRRWGRHLRENGWMSSWCKKRVYQLHKEDMDYESTRKFLGFHKLL